MHRDNQDALTKIKTLKVIKRGHLNLGAKRKVWHLEHRALPDKAFRLRLPQLRQLD